MKSPNRLKYPDALAIYEPNTGKPRILNPDNPIMKGEFYEPEIPPWSGVTDPKRNLGLHDPRNPMYLSHEVTIALTLTFLIRKKCNVLFGSKVQILDLPFSNSTRVIDLFQTAMEDLRQKGESLLVKRDFISEIQQLPTFNDRSASKWLPYVIYLLELLHRSRSIYTLAGVRAKGANRAIEAMTEKWIYSQALPEITDKQLKIHIVDLPLDEDLGSAVNRAISREIRLKIGRILATKAKSNIKLRTRLFQRDLQILYREALK